jgi:hypothetical protein
MNATNSGSPLQILLHQKSSTQYLWEMLSLTRSKDVLVRDSGYEPFYMPQFDRLKMARSMTYTALLVQFH